MTEDSPLTNELHFGVFDHLDRGRTPLDAFYADRLELIKAYDEAGLYGYHVAEHHGTPLGMAPSPSVFLAAVAQQTQRLRFGPMVYLLPFYHPIRLAEEIAMLDQLSRGRFDPGIGRGASPIEAMFYGVESAETQTVFDEVYAIVSMALTRGRVDFEGRHFTFRDVPLAVEPYQRPQPPFWYGITSVESAERCVERGFCAIALAQQSYAVEIAQRYRSAAERAGAAKLKLGLLRFVVVAETDDAALRLARRAYPRWHSESLHHLYHTYALSPAYRDRPDFAQKYGRGGFGDLPDFDAMVAGGKAIAGSPSTVAAAIRAQLTACRANYFVAQLAFGDMTLEESLHSLGLYTREVIPAVKLAAVSS